MKSLSYRTWKKTPTDLSQIIDKLYHIILYRVHLAINGVRTALVMIVTDCIDSCKSNYNTIMILNGPFIELRLEAFFFA